MPDRNSPPKHKTPNYRLVTHTYETMPVFPMGRPRKYSVSTWEPVPLRANRKDI